MSYKRFQIFIRLLKFGGIRLYILNFLFKYFFGLNKQFKNNIHFTSQVIGNNFQYNKDLFTLRSFKTSSNCYFQSLCGIIVGKNFLFASGLKLISGNHDFTKNRKTLNTKPIKIGDNCWVGSNVVILPGVNLGNNCIIGAGSIVTKSFKEDNLIIAGNPAKIIRKINVK